MKRRDALDLIRAWREAQRRGVAVVGLSYSERDHLAAVVLEKDARRAHAAGYTIAAAFSLAMLRIQGLAR